MTRRRYTYYRNVLCCLDALSLRDGEREVARDAAEGFLLSAGDDSWEMAELRLGVSIVLDRAVDSHRLPREVADDLLMAIERCGPEREVPVAA
jgi:hypothetical protein